MTAFVLVAASCASCEELACSVGCSDEQSKCLDNPSGYDPGYALCKQMAAADACARAICEPVYDRCLAQCRPSGQ